MEVRMVVPWSRTSSTGEHHKALLPPINYALKSLIEHGSAPDRRNVAAILRQEP